MLIIFDIVLFFNFQSLIITFQNAIIVDPSQNFILLPAAQNFFLYSFGKSILAARNNLILDCDMNERKIQCRILPILCKYILVLSCNFWFQDFDYFVPRDFFLVVC